jgi:hypothetical protein
MILTVLTVGLFGSQQAFAAKAATLEKQAMKACLSGDYVKGVSILADLFVESSDATYLYNQGRCYEQNVRYVEAAERFREYLRKAPKLSAKEKEMVDQHISECEVAIAKSQKVEPVVREPAPPPEPKREVVEVHGDPPPPAPVAEARPWQRTAKWIAAGAAVGFLGLGVIEHVRYYRKNKDFNDNPSCLGPDPTCKSLADSADTAQLVAIVGYGAAAVATGLAVTFFLTDKPSQAAGQHAGIGVTCAPAPAGVSCAGRF